MFTLIPFKGDHIPQLSSTFLPEMFVYIRTQINL
uniref:Uncharacterized protein n=1 Tax=Ascaris lumbricoides TaxID=6252 RepID=A0A0M3HJZ1_ASCLU